MSLKQVSTVCTAIAFAACASAASANNQNGDHIWMPKQPTNKYWQTPQWSNQNASTQNAPRQPQPTQQQSAQAQYGQAQQRQVQPRQAPPAGYGRGQAAAPYGYGRPQQNYGAPKPVKNMNRSASMPPPPSGPYSNAPDRSAPNSSAPNQSAPNRSAANRSAPGRTATNYRPAPSYRGPGRSAPYGSYRGSPYRGYRDNGASAYYTPGYNRYRSGKKNDNIWSKRKPWKHSGPSKWLSPSKENWEDSWDDMINAPYNMGEMPGGWYAPEVLMPNPVDMGDQFQDNMKDLPEQIRDMNVGNEVSDVD